MTEVPDVGDDHGNVMGIGSRSGSIVILAAAGMGDSGGTGGNCLFHRVWESEEAIGCHDAARGRPLGRSPLAHGVFRRAAGNAPRSGDGIYPALLSSTDADDRTVSNEDGGV